MEYHDLQKTTVVKLREMAHEFGVTDASGRTKEDLVDLIAEKKGIEKPHKVVAGIDKSVIKKEIRALKKVRLEAIANKDRDALHDTQHKLHKLRHKLRKATKIK
jgi:Rho termination factor, N-terminal domain